MDELGMRILCEIGKRGGKVTEEELKEVLKAIKMETRNS